MERFDPIAISVRLAPGKNVFEARSGLCAVRSMEGLGLIPQDAMMLLAGRIVRARPTARSK
jgi:hypothetical protein